MLSNFFKNFLHSSFAATIPWHPSPPSPPNIQHFFLILFLPSISSVSAFVSEGGREQYHISGPFQCCLFSQISSRADNCLHYHPFLLLSTAFLFTHVSCFPPFHIASLLLRFLSFGCDTISRCGQNSSLMPVRDKRVSSRWDARLKSACTASTVWGLEFVCFLLFFHSCSLSVWFHTQAAGCCHRFCRRMNAITGFLLAVYRLDVLKQIVYTLCPMVAKQSSICICSRVWPLWGFFFFFCLLLKCQTSVPFLCLPLSIWLRPNSCFVLFNLTTKSFPSFIGKGVVVFQSHFWVVSGP